MSSPVDSSLSSPVSSPSQASTSSAASSVDGTGLGKKNVEMVLYRAALGELRPHPLTSSRLAKKSRLDKATQRRIEAEVLNVLREHGIKAPPGDDSAGDDAPRIEVVNRCDGDSGEKRPTVLVVPDWDSSSNTKWPAAILQIQSALKSLGTPVSTLDLDVEFIADRLMGPVRDSRAGNDDGDSEADFAKDWHENVYWNIEQILQEAPGTRGRVKYITFATCVSQDDASPYKVFIAIDRSNSEVEFPGSVFLAVEHYLGENVPSVGYLSLSYRS